MDKLIFQSQVTQVNDPFSETFGKGCAIKYRQPSFSERNNIQLDRINDRQKKFKSDAIQKNYEKLGHLADYQRIDQINFKICGLIKSISASCHKIPRKDWKDGSKGKHLNQGVREKGVIREKQFEGISKHLDLQTTEKKKKNLPQHSQTYTKIITKSPLTNFEQLHDINPYNPSDYDSLTQRIDKINKKINNYQNKMKGGINSFQQKSSNLQTSLKQYKNQQNIARKQKQQKLIKYKNSQSKLKTIGKQNIEEKCFSRVEIKDEKKQLVNRKLNYFQEKYNTFEKKKAIKISHTSITEGQENNGQRKDKENKGESNTKAKHIESQRIFSQIQPQGISKATNIINSQLLAYKTTFIREIVKQIAFDQDFRHAKHMFGGIEGLCSPSLGGEKWQKLQKQLKNEGFRMGIGEVQQAFMPRDDEIDPFMSVSHCHEELVHGLIFAYRASEKNWNQNIYHSWSPWELKEAKFTSQNLDQTRKGSITLEDITFYLNTELDGSYRNRDILLIFNRFRIGKAKEEQGVKFRDILDKLISA